MEAVAPGDGRSGLSRSSRKYWIGAAAVALCGMLWLWLGPEGKLTVADLAGRLPQGDRIVAYLDVHALRRVGLLDTLAGRAGIEEAEYRQFVAGSGFDYRRDLDAVLLSYASDETHFFLLGRFDWPKLAQYARQQGGECQGGICRVNSLTPGRKVSFQRLRSGVLALASSSDADAVRRLAVTAPPLLELPTQPVWLMLPDAVLKSKDILPEGTRMFATALLDSERVVLGVDAKDNRFEATLEARSRSTAQADQAMRELRGATTLLNRMLSRDKLEPNPRNLTGMLAKGQFQTLGTRVIATWPVERVLLDSIGEAK